MQHAAWQPLNCAMCSMQAKQSAVCSHASLQLHHAACRASHLQHAPLQPLGIIHSLDLPGTGRCDRASVAHRVAVLLTFPRLEFATRADLPHRCADSERIGHLQKLICRTGAPTTIDLACMDSAPRRQAQNAIHSLLLHHTSLLLP